MYTSPRKYNVLISSNSEFLAGFDTKRAAEKFINSLYDNRGLVLQYTTKKYGVVNQRY